jgi:hypothetical protein
VESCDQDNVNYPHVLKENSTQQKNKGIVLKDSFYKRASNKEYGKEARDFRLPKFCSYENYRIIFCVS